MSIDSAHKPYESIEQYSKTLLEKNLDLENGPFHEMDKKLLKEAFDIRYRVITNDEELFFLITQTLKTSEYVEIHKEVETPDMGQGLAAFRLKLFSGGYPQLNREHTILFQQKIIELDSNLADLFYATSFGEQVTELNLPEENLLNTSEATAIYDFEMSLKDDPKYIEIFKKFFDIHSRTGGFLLDFQSKRLDKIFLVHETEEHDDTQNNINLKTEAILHEKLVAERLSEYTNSPLLELIATVHDFFKHTVSREMEIRGRIELGLHEVGGAIEGSYCITQVALFFQKVFNLPDETISGIKKLVLKVISVHGTDEFPRNFSARNPLITSELLASLGISAATQEVINLPTQEIIKESKLNRLFNSLYPVCQTPESVQLCESDVTPELQRFFQNMARALNAGDKMEGGTLDSFIKYNTSNGESGIAKFSLLSEYIKKSIFASLVECLNPKTFEKLGWDTDSSISDSILKMKQQASLLLLVCNEAEKIKNNPDNFFKTLIKRVKESFSPSELEKLILKAQELIVYFLAIKERLEIVKLLHKTDPKFTAASRELMMSRNNFNTAFKELLQAIKEKDLDRILQEKGRTDQLEKIWIEIENPHH